MRQVPRQTGETVPHLLIGNGRVATHFSRYLTLAGIPFQIWERPRIFTPELASQIAIAERVWLLVSDSAIASVAERLRALLVEQGVEPPPFFHASGATVVEGVRGVHPLMTFGPESYDLPTYERIPFVIEDLLDGVSSDEILAGLRNPAAFLRPEKRALYHALVSVSGNFPAMLWADIFERFENDLGLPRDLLVPFLFRTLLNVIERGNLALTGPLLRGDRATVRKHHEALAGTRLDGIYSAFEKFITLGEPQHERPINH